MNLTQTRQVLSYIAATHPNFPKYTDEDRQRIAIAYFRLFWKYSVNDVMAAVDVACRKARPYIPSAYDIEAEIKPQYQTTMPESEYKSLLDAYHDAMYDTALPADAHNRQLKRLEKAIAPYLDDIMCARQNYLSREITLIHADGINIDGMNEVISNEMRSIGIDRTIDNPLPMQ